MEQSRLLGGAGETISDGAPGRARGRGFDDDEGGAGLIALVEFLVEGARERFGVVGKHCHPAKIPGRREYGCAL